MRAPLRIVRRGLRAAGWEPLRLDRGDVLLRRQATADDAAAEQLEREAGNLRLRELLRLVRPDLVLDVGAHEGGFATRVRDLGYDGRILSFEPNPSVFDTVQRRAREIPRWDVRQLAVGEVEGTLPFHVTRDAQFSSLNRRSAAGEEFGSMMDVMETVGVSVATIDGLDAAERLVTDRTILKVDTQGFDHAVLLGATNALRRIAGVIFEVPVIAIYEGVRHYADTFQLLERAGFGLYALSPIAREHGAMCVMEADAIWLRRHHGNPIP